MATVGDVLTTPESGWNRITFKDERIKFYSGSWADDGEVKYSSSSDALYRFYVKGEAFRIIGCPDNTRGEISVSIDGVVSTYNDYCNTGKKWILVFEADNLIDRTHIVEVKKISGTYLDVMAIDTKDNVSTIISEAEYFKSLIDVTPNMTSNTSPSPYVASASSEYVYSGQPTQYAYRAFTYESSEAKEWRCWTSEFSKKISTSDPQWLMIDMNDDIACDVFTIQARDTSGGYVLSPKDFKIQGSTDGILFDDLVIKNGEYSNIDETKIYISSNSKKYRYYRVYITACNEYSTVGKHVAIQNFRLLKSEKLVEEEKEQQAIPNISHKNASLTYTLPMNTTQKILAKTNDQREGLLGMANDIENYGDLYVVGKDGRAHLTKSGVKSEIIFDGVFLLGSGVANKLFTTEKDLSCFSELCFEFGFSGKSPEKFLLHTLNISLRDRELKYDTLFSAGTSSGTKYITEHFYFVDKNNIMFYEAYKSGSGWDGEISLFKIIGIY